MHYIKSLLSNFNQEEVIGGDCQNHDRLIFITALLSGIIAHGYMFTTKIIYADEIYYSFGLGSTFPSNRWGLGIVYHFGSKFFDFFSNPLFNGLISVTFIAFSCMLLYRLLDLHTKISAIILSMTMVVFPVIASIFICMFTAPMYQISLFLSVLAIYILKENRSFTRILLSSIAISISLGIYQAYITVSLCTAILLLIVKLMNSDLIKKSIYHGMCILAAGILGLIEYFIINKIFLIIVDTTAIDYKGMDTMGQLDLGKMPSLVIETYKNYFVDYTWNGINAFIIIPILLFIIAVVTVILFFTNIDIPCRNKVCISFLFLLFPLCANSIYLMSTDEGYNVTNLMQYSLMMSLCIPVIILDKLWFRQKKSAVIQTLTLILTTFLLCVNFVYSYIDNSCYLKATYLQKQADTYYTTLISTIKQTPGYKDEYPVAFIGDFNIDDRSITVNTDMAGIEITGYHSQTISYMLEYRPIEYMKINCGYSPQLAENTNELENLDAVKNMTSYPDYGSVKIINDTVVVKVGQ